MAAKLSSKPTIIFIYLFIYLFDCFCFCTNPFLEIAWQICHANMYLTIVYRLGFSTCLMGFVDRLSRAAWNPVNFFLLIVIGFLILLRLIKFLGLNEITVAEFDEVIILSVLNLIVLVECDWKFRCWILYHFAFHTRALNRIITVNRLKNLKLLYLPLDS